MRRLALWVLVAAIAGCSPSRTASPTGPASTIAPSQTQPAAASPTDTVAPTFSGPYVPEIAVRVTVDELAVREAPAIDSALVAILKRDDVIVLSRLPRQADGFTWYEAARVGTGGTLPALPAGPDAMEPLVAGYVPVATATKDNVTPMPARCPNVVDLVNVSGMLESEWLACFGNETIELVGTFGCGGCGGASSTTYEPVWLANALAAGFLSVEPRVRFGPLALRFGPEGPEEPEAGSILRVRGHFDDPLAQTCVITDIVGPEDHQVTVTVDPKISVGICRHSFVVESYDVLGSDPSFPLG